MKFGGVLLIVEDIAIATKFYQEVLEQQVTMDLGEHVSFENGLALQTNYGSIVGKELTTTPGANTFQLYFEVEGIQTWAERLAENSEVTFLHSIKEYPWGQRSFRIYDPNQNIIEIAESMAEVIGNLIEKDLSTEAIAKKTMCPVDYIETLRD